ncbi:hypothetical protein DNK47_01400 [Mycoplasma wenyonii]|uniref:Uncharacterized protein n=1 Tax=Mycoplasma wenyonii TaxID=65123 RepID=A0A328PQH3_9MOLU|nr:hypothetical protein [Mycoplasma wenyonii]RAO95128.1 hypothetical protein DNK47_01400 [Mycoplasma wenyonii]
MQKFGTWFSDFFLSSLSSGEGDEESIDLERVKVRLSWLFGSSLYLSFFSFLLYIVGFSAIHLSGQIKDKYLIEKIFFFISPTVWQNYLFSGGGLFNSFRRADNFGESIFISINLGLIAISFIALIFNLIVIHTTWQKALKQLRIACYTLCFPVFGGFLTLLMIGYWKGLEYKSHILKWFSGRQHMNKLWDKASEIIEKVGTEKREFKPKTLAFLELKKENKVSEILGRLDKYVIKKI